ncbi:hypothetical protein POPTR_012G023250v4 [Populus trichocarpa]|uniref:Uncharacterized protein n=1 Tax=Populus trichocarpa TaxID=3694 RepID=A0ACC0S4R3_POPTR|nr:hypothetical protein POPTR_012G023250v4 [Populus trichocarpa]
MPKKTLHSLFQKKKKQIDPFLCPIQPKHSSSSSATTTLLKTTKIVYLTVPVQQSFIIPFTAATKFLPLDHSSSSVVFFSFFFPLFSRPATQPVNPTTLLQQAPQQPSSVHFFLILFHSQHPQQ